MRAPRLAIIADDLTGALDASAPFSGCAHVRVAVAVTEFPEVLASGADIVAVSTGSREIAECEARQRVAHALSLVPPGTRVMKKIDSRLKGNVAAELDAFAGRHFVVLPAIPEFGRVVSGGALQGFGVETPIAISRCLGAIRADIPDTVSDADMDAAAGAADEEAVLVGARGLAQALARAMGANPAEQPQLSGPMLFAVGSNDPITLAQVAALSTMCPDACYVAAPSGDAAARPPDARSAVTILQATSGSETRRDAVARHFAASVAGWIEGMRMVLLTGGATAEAVFDKLGICALVVEGEALPGLPLCRVGERIFVTKSGGFGAADTLVRLICGPQTNRWKN